MRLVEVTYQVVPKERTAATLCDCCGGTIEDNPDLSFDLARIEHNEDGPGRTEFYDVCAHCWDNNVIKLFKTGPRRVEW